MPTTIYLKLKGLWQIDVESKTIRTYIELLRIKLLPFCIHKHSAIYNNDIIFQDFKFLYVFILCQISYPIRHL